MPVLILGGTSDARALAELLPGSISSLAGRVREPVLPPGAVRIGGFGGVAGLVSYLRSAGITAVVDATHPFAARMTAHAAQACALEGIPLVILRRPGWSGGVRVPSLEAAAARLTGRRVFLTTGRQDLATFAEVDAWFLVRSVDPPEPPVPQRMLSILDRGPFTVEGETVLMREHAIDVLVTKDSGARAVAAKLDAARRLGIEILMVDRPPLPPGVEVVEAPAAAARFVTRLRGQPPL